MTTQIDQVLITVKEQENADSANSKTHARPEPFASVSDEAKASAKQWFEGLVRLVERGYPGTAFLDLHRAVEAARINRVPGDDEAFACMMQLYETLREGAVAKALVHFHDDKWLGRAGGLSDSEAKQFMDPDLLTREAFSVLKDKPRHRWFAAIVAAYIRLPDWGSAAKACAHLDETLTALGVEDWKRECVQLLRDVLAELHANAPGEAHTRFLLECHDSFIPMFMGVLGFADDLSVPPQERPN